jgi:hypothetical protein
VGSYPLAGLSASLGVAACTGMVQFDVLQKYDNKSIQKNEKENLELQKYENIHL